MCKIRISIVFRTIFLFICGFGILRHFTPDNSEYNAYMMSFFTIQANILAFIVFLLLLLNSLFQANKLRVFRRELKLDTLRGVNLLTISIMFIVFNYVLRTTDYTMTLERNENIPINDIIVHYIVPAMVFVDWIAFQPKNKFRWFSPFIWLLAPITYFCVIMVRAAIAPISNYSKYPYFIMDIDTYGILFVTIYSVAFCIASILLGCCILYTDRLMYKISIRKSIVRSSFRGIFSRLAAKDAAKLPDSKDAA